MLALLAPRALADDDDEARSRGGRTYTVPNANLTKGKVFSPPIVQVSAR